ncbi:hypothetical protein CBR_g38374 [Chara braunii]|uniref:Myb-like domain-containing protein n=1 Tax=Chara braunii TaxID=69332 RepID=A0A388JNJ8_CHABU|nr:hypothetical protein CBR_g38374 [Chara braunii]|eukprot:GBG59345.1 hypothetical protein CBR_g38374 [Chara braunii]
MYTYLESWETPLPPSDEEPEKEELSTLPLASGSTRLWSQTVRAGGSAADEGGEFTSLLQQGLRDDDGGGVDLRFGLCSGGGKEASRTFIIDGDRSARGLEHGGSLHTELSTLRRAALVTGAVGPSSAGRKHGSTAPSVERLTPTWPARTGVATGSLSMGGARSPMPACTTPIESEVRDEGTCIAPIRPRPTVENITRGVSNMRAHSDGGEDDGGFGDDADEGMREDVEAGDDDDDVPIRPLGKTGGRGKGRGRGGVRGRSVAQDQMPLVRCKREQDMHLAGLTHNYRRIKTKEWKWDDMSNLKRMANAGRPKDADECMKKWDNLFQNYKKNQRFQNASGQANFFRLTNEEGKEHNFKFRMDRALYNEIHIGMVGNHTIFPPNVADTGSPEGVQLPRRGAGGGESVCSEAAGEGCPEERSSARESDNNAGSGAGGGKRKNARLQALESIADDRHGGRTCRRRRSIFPPRGRDVVDGPSATFIPVVRIRSRINVVRTRVSPPPKPATPAAHFPPRIYSSTMLFTGDNCGLLHASMSTAFEDHRRHHCSHLVTWTSAVTTQAAGRSHNIVHETKEYFVAIASGLPPPDLPLSVVLPKSSTRVARIADQSQLQQAISRAAAVENIALRILHGWVFKSGNCPRGYHLAFQYSLESVVTDIACAMWYGEEWCNVVSATIRAHTIDLNMNLPLWYAGANIEDRPEDDNMAAHQESTVIRIVHSFRAAVQMGAHIDGDFISYERLCRVADCFRLLLAASMWIMRMAGDDPCSHYEAFYFDLVARPTLVTSMHRSFDHRRSVVRTTNVVTERLGKAKATLGVCLDYIPDWAPCGIGFAHEASIKGPEDAKRLDWLGPGPPDDGNKGEGKGCRVIGLSCVAHLFSVSAAGIRQNPPSSLCTGLLWRPWHKHGLIDFDCVIVVSVVTLLAGGIR